MIGMTRFTVALTLFALAGIPQARAEPQILGLIASLEPVTLQCERGQCGAEFTSYCIEQNRRPPEMGAAYTIHDANSLIVEAVAADGAATLITDPGLLQIASARGRSAVRMSLPANYLKDNGYAAVRVTVKARATLIPVPIIDARRPHTARDIALATGPLRDAAETIIDRGGLTVDAALMTAQLINALPRGGRASETQRAAVWPDVALSPQAPGYKLAESGFERCARVTKSGMMSLRQCLGSVHDRLISKLNVEYWKAVKTGS